MSIAAMVVIMFGAGITTTLWEANIARVERQRAEKEALDARAQRATAEQERQRTEKSSSEAQRQRALADRQREAAEKQKLEAERQRREAVGLQLISRSQTLAAQAEQILAGDQPAALDLAILGWQTAKTPEANLAVAHAFPHLLAKLVGHTDAVWQAAFSSDGQSIVTASEDVWPHTARVWNAANGQLRTSFNADVRIVWSPLARVWNVANGQLLASLVGHTAPVRQAAFSPDGQRIVTASGDKTAGVYHVITLSDIAKLLGK
jgi:WD40 repeat protein